MLGDGGIGDEREAEFLEPRPGASGRLFPPRRGREEAAEDDLQDFLAGQLRLEAPADDPRPSTGDRHRPAIGREVGEELLLGGPAGVSEGAPLLGVEPGGAQLLLDPVGEGQVDVVAAEHEVVADGHPPKTRAAGRLDDRDQAEVRRTAADVADQDQFARADLSLPDVLMGHDPAVKGRLRLFEEDRLGDPGPLRGVDGQLAGRLVERRGDGQDHFLSFQAVGLVVPGEAVVPGVPDLRDVVGRGLDRRDLAGLGRRAPGQDGGFPVHARMAEPALGRGDQMPRHPGPLDPGELAHDPVGIAPPGEPGRPRGQLVLPGQIEEGREHRPGGRLPRRHQLRDLERPDVPGGPLATLGVHVSHGAVRGPEVDADDVSRACHGRPSWVLRAGRAKG